MHSSILDQRALPLAAPSRRAVRRRKRVVVLGNYPPRRCGIATFTADLFAALNEDADCVVVAMKDPLDEAVYEHPVSQVIRQNVVQDYVSAAKVLNEAGTDIVALQHEFGIFGGVAGDHLLTFLEEVKCAVISTLHTVLKDPNEDQCRVLSAIVRRSTRVVVMSELGRDILIQRYNTPAGKIVVIPHGAPDRPFVSTEAMKQQLGFAQRDLLLTFGLLSPNKGIESVIRALPSIIALKPQALYVVLGATHPHQVLNDGEGYRQTLKDLAKKLGVAAHVQFIDQFVDLDALLDYITAADIYITPYLNPAQITSGTLSYAVALGKPVVSTPYWHAEELLRDDVGVIVPFNDPTAMADAIGELLVDSARRGAYAQRAYARGRETIWSRMGETFLATCDAAIREHNARTTHRANAIVVEPSFAAIARMSDDCGMLQHAKRAIPDRKHGYCLDDTARSLILLVRGSQLGVRLPMGPRRVETYAAFVEHAWNPDAGRFRNFMSYDRQWLEARGSEDSTGRGVWCLGEVARWATDTGTQHWARDLAALITPHLHDIAPLRASAFCILGLRHLLQRDPDHIDHADLMRACADRLHRALEAQRKPGWTWFESTLTYDNARLAEALLAAGIALDDRSMRADALESLIWLAGVQTVAGGVYQPVGNRSFHLPYVTPAQFDQQPVEVAATIDACALAYEVTRDVSWIDEAGRAYAWFLGANTGGVTMRSADGAGCHDGLGEHGVNVNQGAESVLAFQLANCSMKRLRRRAVRALPAT